MPERQTKKNILFAWLLVITYDCRLDCYLVYFSSFCSFGKEVADRFTSFIF